MSTVSDYDARRVSDVETADGSALRELAPVLPGLATAVVDDDPNGEPVFELPGADLLDEELSMAVIPRQTDEFTCSSCHLVQHRSRLHSLRGEPPMCADCG